MTDFQISNSEKFWKILKNSWKILKILENFENFEKKSKNITFSHENKIWKWAIKSTDDARWLPGSTAEVCWWEPMSRPRCRNFSINSAQLKSMKSLYCDSNLVSICLFRIELRNDHARPSETINDRTQSMSNRQRCILLMRTNVTITL